LKTVAEKKIGIDPFSHLRKTTFNSEKWVPRAYSSIGFKSKFEYSFYDSEV